MELNKAIDLLESLIKNPQEGLPEDIFLLVSRITPIVNVDLLIKNEENHTLLTWRDDGYYPPGWHIPGGIVRYKETISDRINAVAASELGAEIKFKKDPLAINEVIHPSRRVRGHFISLLYGCTLISSLDKNLRYEKGIPKPGEWWWHNKCPGNIISVHEMYRKFI
jgi:colanic acid biosynthesis protein WcaH